MSRGRSLLRYLLARLALAPVMLWLIASLVFLLLRVAPGDPIDALLGSRAPAAARASVAVRAARLAPRRWRRGARSRCSPWR